MKTKKLSLIEIHKQNRKVREMMKKEKTKFENWEKKYYELEEKFEKLETEHKDLLSKHHTLFKLVTSEFEWLQKNRGFLKFKENYCYKAFLNILEQYQSGDSIIRTKA